MRKNIKLLASTLIGFGVLAVSSTSFAQEVYLGAEVGLATPLTDPQAQRFSTGGEGAVKLDMGIGSYLSWGPVLQVIQLPSKLSGVEAGNAWGYGAYLKVKRPYDELNTDKGLRAFSPWVDLQTKMVHTDPLDRFGASVGAGVSVPTSDERNLWLGPFVRYDITHQSDDKVGHNTNSAKMFIIGLSMDLGLMKHKQDKQVAKYDYPPPAAPPSPVVQTKVEEPVLHDTQSHLRCVVGFAYDSDVLRPEAVTQLKEVVSELSKAKSIKEIRVEGHASAEGDEVYNHALSLRRANVVVRFLAENGLPQDKLSAVGFGVSHPAFNNDNEANRAKNRRVEFEVDFVVVEEVQK